MTTKTIQYDQCNAAPTAYACAIGAMKEKARALGYALTLHGSMIRDLDLVAIPWVDEAAEPEALVEAIRECVGGFIHSDGTPAGKWNAEKQAFEPAEIRNPGIKPHGRLCWTIHLGGAPFIDLSVMPRIPLRIPPGPGGKGGDNS